MQPLQHYCCAGGELGQHLGGIHLIWHLGTKAGRPNVTLACQDVAVLGHANKRRANPALGDQLINRRRRQQIGEVAGQRAGPAE